MNLWGAHYAMLGPHTITSFLSDSDSDSTSYRVIPFYYTTRTKLASNLDELLAMLAMWYKIFFIYVYEFKFNQDVAEKL